MKAFLRTFGCRANQYDTESVRALLLANGIDETADASEADVAIFNSCTVTTAAEADLRSGVRMAARANSGVRTIIMGCAAALPNRDERSAPLATLPTVHAVVAGADIDGIAMALGVREKPVASAQTGARALLGVQDGCDEHCTFCATTVARGGNRSRPIGSLVAEAAMLAETHPEIVLTGIHIGTYGSDTESSLGELVEALVADVPHVRFRLSSVEATEVDARLARLLTHDASRLAPHLHAPLQSGSDAVLRRMGRNWYDATSYELAVQRVIGDTGVFALSGDVITGFPGETESDHMLTMGVVERLPFTSLHVFPYSPRPGTAATRLRGQVEPVVSGRRAAELRELARAKAAAYASSRVGGQCDVVVTERGTGLTEDYLTVSTADAAVARRARFRATLSVRDGRLTATAA